MKLKKYKLFISRKKKLQKNVTFFRDFTNAEKSHDTL